MDSHIIWPYLIADHHSMITCTIKVNLIYQHIQGLLYQCIKQKQDLLEQVGGSPSHEPLAKHIKLQSPAVM